MLINPARGSGPLELSATLVKDRPRRVSLVDPDGKPVVGAWTIGLTAYPHDSEPLLRDASLVLTKLHPARVRRITFIKAYPPLVGFLLARGDADIPYTVRMQPCGTVTGRIVDETGKPLKASLSTADTSREAEADLGVGMFHAVGTDAEGRFRIDSLVPGQRYSAKIELQMGQPARVAFKNLILRAGEARDLGDIRTEPSAHAESTKESRK